MKKMIFTFILLAGYALGAYAQGEEAEPPYGMGHLEAYSLFYENYRSGDYEMALTFGEWMLEAKPREIQGHSSFRLETQFDRLIKVYAGLAEEETDPTERSQYYQQALGVFDLVRETFDEGEIDLFEWTLQQGQFYQEHRRELENGLQNAFDHYEQAYEMDTARFAEMSDGYYAQLLLNHYVSSGERDQALQMIDEVEPLASASLQDVIDNTRNELFSSPEERIGLLESRLEESEDEEEILMELADLYEEVGDREKAREAAETLYEINPSFENTQALAERALSNAEYNEALRYLEEAVEKSPGDEERKSLLLEISETQQNLGNLQEARNSARQAIDVDSNYGAAYMRIASIYAAAISECTSGRSMERDDRTVYWLVLDYLERAKQVDSSTTNAANRRIESYTPVMPTTEDKFFRDWETGDSFEINSSVGECYGWINETTTIR